MLELQLPARELRSDAPRVALLLQPPAQTRDPPLRASYASSAFGTKSLKTALGKAIEATDASPCGTRDLRAGISCAARAKFVGLCVQNSASSGEVFSLRAACPQRDPLGSREGAWLHRWERKRRTRSRAVWAARRARKRPLMRSKCF